MNKVLALILILALVLGGPICCIVKALLGIEQRKLLKQKVFEMHEEV